MIVLRFRAPANSGQERCLLGTHLVGNDSCRCFEDDIEKGTGLVVGRGILGSYLRVAPTAGSLTWAFRLSTAAGRADNVPGADAG